MTIYLASSGNNRALVRAGTAEKARWLAAKLEADRRDDPPEDYLSSWDVAELTGPVTLVSDEGRDAVLETWWVHLERDRREDAVRELEDTWHEVNHQNSDSTAPTLQAWLGMTDDQFASWSWDRKLDDDYEPPDLHTNEQGRIIDEALQNRRV